MVSFMLKSIGAVVVCAGAMFLQADDGIVKKTGFSTDNSGPQRIDQPGRPRRIAPPLSETPPEESLPETRPLALPTPVQSSAAGGIFVRPLVLPQCTIKMPDEIHIPVEVAGVLAEMFVDEGAIVKKGAIVAKLDERMAKLDEEHKKRSAENQSSVETAQRKIDHYQAQLKIAERLEKTGTGSLEDLEVARTQVDLAIAERKDAELKMLLADIDHEKAEELLRRHAIRSPVNGVISHRLKHPGEAVQAMEPILHVVRTDRVKIQGQVDPRNADRLKSGMIVEVWPDIAVGERAFYEHTAPIRCVRVLPGDRLVAFGGEDGWVVVRNLATGGVEREIKASAKPIRGLAASPAEPNQLVTCSDDGSIRFWNLADGLEVRPALRTSERGETSILSVCIDAKNPSLGWSGHADGRIWQWDFAKGVVVRSLKASSGDKAHINPVTYLALAPDGESLLSVGDDNAVRWWKTSDGSRLASLDNRSGPSQKEVRQLNFSPDGTEIPFNSDALVQFRKLPETTVQDTMESLQQSFASFVLMTPTPGLVLTAREDGELQLWQRAKEHRPARLARVFRGHRTDALVQQVDFSSNGKYFVSCGADRTVRVWTMPTVGELEAERLAARISFVDPQAGPTGASAFSADVDNRGGVLKGNTTASVVVYPQ
jgi:WD40 repeat protein/biotin carboxyl carrier protein